MSDGMNDDVNFTPGVQARVVLDSIGSHAPRLTTIEVTLHRFVLPEFNTHRVFSRNSASSRAIPFHKQVRRVMDYPAVPISFPAEQRGMQGGEEVAYRQEAERKWLEARDNAVHAAKMLSQFYGVHKSVANRLLEPFMWHTIIVTATEWDGFWAQRCSPLAQPEIRVAAEAMRKAYEESTPTQVLSHTPYITREDREDVWRLPADYGTSQSVLRRVSAARCARVSYLTHDGQRDLTQDLSLYDRLVSARPLHASPLEHVARPMAPGESQRGNLIGWRQMRHDVEDRS